MYPLSPGGPGGRRVDAFISAHAGRLRTLGHLNATDYRELLEQNRFSEYLDDIDGRFAMWDLRTDPSDCLPLKYSTGPTNESILVSCALLPGNPRRAGMVPVWERMTRLFDHIENACPALFSPSGGFTSRRGEMWYRYYINTDILLRVLDGRLSYSRYNFGPFDVNMGTPEDWEAGDVKWICARLPPHWKSPASR